MKGVKSEENRNHKKLISFVSFTIFNCYSSQLCSQSSSSAEGKFQRGDRMRYKEELTLKQNTLKQITTYVSTKQEGVKLLGN